MKKDYVYRCSKECPIGKRCFVIKVKDKIKLPMQVLFKCKAQKREILLKIEDGSNDFIIEKEMVGENE